MTVAVCRAVAGKRRGARGTDMVASPVETGLDGWMAGVGAEDEKGGERMDGWRDSVAWTNSEMDCM